jgi:hypothetical protein
VTKLAASQGPSRNTQIGTLSVDVTIQEPSEQQPWRAACVTCSRGEARAAHV